MCRNNTFFCAKGVKPSTAAAINPYNYDYYDNFVEQ